MSRLRFNPAQIALLQSAMMTPVPSLATVEAQPPRHVAEAKVFSFCLFLSAPFVVYLLLVIGTVVNVIMCPASRQMISEVSIIPVCVCIHLLWIFVYPKCLPVVVNIGGVGFLLAAAILSEPAATQHYLESIILLLICMHRISPPFTLGAMLLFLLLLLIRYIPHWSELYSQHYSFILCNLAVLMCISHLLVNTVRKTYLQISFSEP